MRLTRQQFVTTVGTLLFGGCTAYAPTSSQSKSKKSEWRMFNRNAANTGYASGRTVPKSASMDWQSTGFPETTTSPVVGAGRVIISTATKGTLAYALEDGSPEWATPLEFEPGGTPAIHESSVFITEDDRYRGGQNARVHALNLANGKKLWSQSLDAEAVLSPTVTDASVFVRTNTGIVSLSPSSGEVQWSKSVPGQFGDRYYDITADVAPAVLDDRVVFPSGDGLVAVGIESGEKLWQISAQKVRAAPSADGDRVYYSDVANGVRAVAAESGETVWNYDASGCWTTPAVGDGQVVTSVQDTIIALDAKSGKKQWASDSLRGDIYTCPVIAGDRVVAGSINASAVALSAKNGDIRWRVGEGTRRSPALSGDTVFSVGRFGGSASQEQVLTALR